MNFSPFSCPIFLGPPEARGLCSQSEWLLYGRDLCRSGGTGKAEASKLAGRGIGPKPCPGNEWQKKMGFRQSVKSVLGRSCQQRQPDDSHERSRHRVMQAAVTCGPRDDQREFRLTLEEVPGLRLRM